MALYVNCNTGAVESQEEVELEDGRRRWNERKNMSLHVAALMSAYDPDRAALIRGCGTYLEFVKVPDNSLKLHKANFCRQRLCPMCQWRRSIKLRAQADQTYKVLMERGYQHVFLTLTQRNSPPEDLKRDTDNLMAALRRFQRSAFYSRAVRGSYRALEITYNADKNTYHPHIHMLLTVDGNYFRRGNPDYMTHKELVKVWRDCARLDYDPRVHIEGIHPRNGQTMTGACAEMCKYPTKTAQFATAEQLMYADYALRGRRLIQWAGVAADVRRELDLDDVETGNLIQTTDLAAGDVPLETVVYIWRYGIYLPLDYKLVNEMQAAAGGK